MPKTLLDIMDPSDECIVEFERACAELAEARYILAERKISQLLQVIAKSKNLYALMGACMQGFDFGAELNKAKTPTGLVLPESRKKMIAFVFCLLLSFDTNQTDFKKFLHTFYPSDEINTEYADFARAVIAPFAHGVVKSYYAEADEPQYVPAAPSGGSDISATAVSVSVPSTSASASSVSAPSRPGMLDALKVQSLSEIACEIIGIVARDPAIADKPREELMLVCEAFDQAVKIGAEKAIRTMYIGLKYTIKSSPLVRQLEMQLENLKGLIIEYDLD